MELNARHIAIFTLFSALGAISTSVNSAISNSTDAPAPQTCNARCPQGASCELFALAMIDVPAETDEKDVQPPLEVAKSPLK